MQVMPTRILPNNPNHLKLEHNLWQFNIITELVDVKAQSHVFL